MKQTDYDKRLKEVAFEIEKELGFYDMDILKAIFRKGYEYGIWSQMEKQKAEQQDHERNLVALGDDYMTARIDAKDNGFNRWCDSDVNHDTLSAYFQGWEDADAFDDDWTKAHPKDLLDRIIDEYPDMIENEVKARMKDVQNEQAEHFRDDKKKLRAEIAKDIYVGCLVSSNDSLRMQSWQNLRQNAKECIEAADALLAELE